jgi:hypothetical protein
MTNLFKKQLVKKLSHHGLTPEAFPGFMKIFSSSLNGNMRLTLNQVNQRITYLGWQDGEIDYHTYQLALAYLESAGN